MPLPRPYPGALHAAERQLDAAADAVAVDEDLAGADARGDAVRAARGRVVQTPATSP